LILGGGGRGGGDDGDGGRVGGGLRGGGDFRGGGGLLNRHCLTKQIGKYIFMMMMPSWENTSEGQIRI
jgi:hypothetical protein